MKWSQMFSLWIEYIGIALDELAVLSGKNRAYLSSLKRGRRVISNGKRPGGINKPRPEQEEQIFDALKRTCLKKFGKEWVHKHMPHGFSSDVFWNGPPSPVFQARIRAAPGGSQGSSHGGDQAAHHNPAELSGAAPPFFPALDLAIALESPQLYWKGAAIGHAKKKLLRSIIAAYLEGDE